MHQQLAIVTALIGAMFSASSARADDPPVPIPGLEIPFYSDLYPMRHWTFDTNSQRLVTVMDITEDGRPDLIVVDSSGNLSVRPGTGRGNFGASQPLGTVLNPAVVWGDIDGDGRLDFVSPAAAIRNLGGGAFAPYVAHSQDLFSAGVELADVDGDGDLDLVTRLGVDRCVVRRNNGSGAFVFASEFTVTTSAWISAADLNGDGCADIMSGSQLSTQVRVHPSNCDGTFAAPTVALTVTGDPTRATLGDIDGDGDIDALVPMRDPNRVAIYKNQGDGSMASSGAITTPGEPGAPHLVDLDGDGDLDLVIPIRNEARTIVLQNSGSGQFASQSTTWTSGSTSVADVDGDGRPDLIFDASSPVQRSGAAVVLQGPGGVFAQRTVAPMDTLEPFDIAVGNVTGDASPDIVVANRASMNISVLRNNAAGTSFSRQNYLVAEGLRAVALADLDGDGLLDAVFGGQASNDAPVLWNTSGTFTGRTDLASAGWISDVAVADADNDGDTDIAVANPGANGITVFRNQGARQFIADPFLPVAGQISGVDWVDLNADDFPDLIASTATGHAVLLADGLGGFLAPTPTNLPLEPSRSIAVGDLDNDGAPDIVSFVSLSSNPILTIERNDGAGGLTPWTTIQPGTRVGAAAIRDIDADGHADVVLSLGLQPSRIAVYRGNSAGAFTLVREHACGIEPRALAFADFNNDGRVDLAAADDFEQSVSIIQSLRQRQPKICPGDLDGDDAVNATDFAILAAHYGSIVEPDTSGDLDGDGQVTAADFSIFAADFGCAP